MNKIIFCIALLISSFCFADTKLDIGTTTNIDALGKYFEFLVDHHHSETIETVLNNTDDVWQKSNQRIPSFGFSHNTYWMRLNLVNTSNNNLSQFLTVSYPALDLVNFYFVQENKLQLKIKAGDSFAFAERDIKHRFFLFPVELAANKSATVYLQVRSEGAIQIPASIYEKEAFYEKDEIAFAAQLIFIGFMFAIALYNLIIFISIREKAYIFYVAYVVCYCLLQMSLHGFAYQYLWPNALFWNSISIVIMLGATVFFAGLFSYFFLDLNKSSKFLAYSVYAFVLSSIVIICITPFISYSFSVIATPLIGILGCVICLVVGFIQWKRGHKGAKIYTIAWSIFLFGGLFILLNRFGFVPRNFLSENSTQIGAMIEVFMLSLALADRLNRERRKTIEYQRRALKQEAIARETQDEAIKQLQVFSEHLEENNKKLDRMNAELTIARDEAVEAYRVKSAFLSNMSHELCTPLNAVIGFSDLLRIKTSDYDADVRDKIDKICAAGQHLNSIVLKVLDATSIDSGKYEISRQKINIRELIGDVLKEVRSIAEENNNQINIDLDEGSTEIISDPIYCQQGITYIIENAFRFTKDGYIKIITHDEVIDGKAYLIISIEDNGIGMTENQVRKMFDDFYQADTSDTRQFDGTGLSLGLSKRIFDKLGVMITVTSKPLAGTTITLAFLLE